MSTIEPLQVTMADAVTLTSIPRRTLDEMIARGALASNKVGRRRYIPMTEIRRLTLAVVGGSARPTAHTVAGAVAGSDNATAEKTKQKQQVA